MKRKSHVHIPLLLGTITLLITTGIQTNAAFQGPPASANPPTGGGLMGVDPNRNVQLFDIQAGSANATPAGTLDGAAFGRVFMITADNNPGIGVKDISADRGYIFTARNNGTLALWDDVARAVRFYVDQSGNIAVGSTDPALAKLHVFGDTRTEGAFIGGRMQAAFLASDVFGDFTGGGNFAFPAGLGIGTNSVSGLPTGGLYVAGSVGIGTPTNLDGKLNVKASDDSNLTIDIGLKPSVNDSTQGGIGVQSAGVIGWNAYNQHSFNLNGGAGYHAVMTIKNDKVGIGTIEPDAKLDVKGGAAFREGEFDIFPNLSNLSFIDFNTLTSDGNTYPNVWRWITGNENSYLSDGSLRLQRFMNYGTNTDFVVSRTGNVGIGTNPNDKLDVAGNLRILTGTNPIRFTGAWTDFPNSPITATNQAEISNDTGSYKTLMIVGNRSNDVNTRRVSIWDRLEVNGNFVTTGNVSIGTPTTAPSLSTKLHVAGDVKVEGDVIANNTGASTEISAANVSGGATFGSLATKGNYIFEGALNTNPVLFVDATNERVGIGTPTPSAKLHVDGGEGIKVTNVVSGFMHANNPSGINAALRLRQDSTVLTTYVIESGRENNMGSARDLSLNPIGGNVGIGTPNPNWKLHVANSTDNTSIITWDKPGFRAFRSGFTGTTWVLSDSDALSASARLAIDNSGRVGIGIVNPGVPLDVNGRIRSNSADGGLWLSNTTDGFVGNNSGNIGFWTSGVGWNALQIEKTTGRVGIGTQTPQHALDIQGAYYSRMVVKGSVSGAVTINWNEGNVQHITLVGNTSLTFTGGQSGGRYVLVVKQDATGGRTITWPTNSRFPGGATFNVTATAGRTDYMGFLYNGVDAKYDNVAFSAAFF